MAVHAIVPAAGSGTRMGGGVPKQFRELAGEPVLARTVRVLLSCGQIDTLTLVVPPADLEAVRSEILPQGQDVSAQAAAGGADRQESVWKGILALGNVAPDEIVLVHDGVRPFLTPPVIEQVIQAARKTGAATCGVPSKDTIKLVGKSGLVESTLDRSRCYLVQTPQAFRYEILRRAHEEWMKSATEARATDDAMMVERLGLPVTMTEGLYENIKLTTPEDFLLADAFVRGGRLGGTA